MPTYGESSWQIGVRHGMPVYSRRHLTDGVKPALCGAKINWRYGNASHNNSGPCVRCYAIATKKERHD